MGLLGTMSTCTRRLRTDVAKRDHAVVPEHDGGGNLPGDDLLEYRGHAWSPLGGSKNTRPDSAASTRRVAVASGAASPHNRLPLKLTLDTLRTHLAGEPARAYLVSGDEVLLVSEAADAIRARIKRAGFEQRDVHFIERVADWDAVRASANNLSLFGSRKLIELRLPSGKPGVGGANAIVELLAAAGPDNVFLMITGKLEREQNNSAWVKAFESGRRVAAGVAD